MDMAFNSYKNRTDNIHDIETYGDKEIDEIEQFSDDETDEIEPFSDDETDEVEPFTDDETHEIEPFSDDETHEIHVESCPVDIGAQCSDGMDYANHHGNELRRKACPQNCASKLSSKDFLELRKNKPNSQKEHTQWLLDFFFEHATQDSVCHLVCGKEICEKCWREIHNVSAYKYNKYLSESRNGVREKIHANTGSVRPSIQNSESIGWFLNFVNEIGENMPHQEKVTLPAGMKKTEVWKMMASELDYQSLSKSSFLQIWNRSFGHVTVVKENPFSKCHICTTLHFEFEKCGRYDRDGKILILNRKKQHWEYVRKQKEAYYERREISRFYPNKCLTIIMDGMDQKKTNIPILYSKSRNSKQIANLQQVRTHLLGVLVHRDSDVSGARKVGYGYFDLLQYPHDSNLNLTILLQTLHDFKDTLGREFHLQTDSASDNKNKIVLGFLGILVYLGIFEECYLHMLPVGHTHEDIDAMFSNFSSLLRADVMTLDDLINAFQKLSYVKEGKFVKIVWDFKEWMLNHLLNNHGLGDQFEFRVHTLDKERRIPVFHYRRGEGERWLPDSDDEHTYEHQQDKCGILIFKDMNFLNKSPKLVVQTEKNMYLNRIVQDTCPKLLESGLLKPDEKRWWEEFTSTVKETYLTPPININFPLESLVRGESRKSPSAVHPVERTLQELDDRTKRKSLVYTGGYITHKRRKAAR